MVVVGLVEGSAYATLAEDALAQRPAGRPRAADWRGLTPPRGAPSPFREGVHAPADRPGGTSVWPPDVARSALYGRLSPDAAEKLVQHLGPMAQPRLWLPAVQPPGQLDVAASTSLTTTPS